MNWMGGARNRVKFHGEKQIQREFFDSHQLIQGGIKSQTSKTPLNKRKKHSQDLLALHTVSQTHSQFPGVNRIGGRSIKKVDLGKFQSCTRQIADVDMGSCSPSNAPCNNIFDDNDGGGNTDRMRSYKFITTNKPKSSTELQCHSDATAMENIDLFKEKIHQNVLKSHKEIIPAELDINSRKQKLFDNMIYGQTQQSRNFFSKSHIDRNDSIDQSNFDPFVSEDFQLTPLLRFSKKRAIDNSTPCCENQQSKKFNHSTDFIYANFKPGKNSEIGLHYTSTPIKGSAAKKSFTEGHFDVSQVSPAFKSLSAYQEKHDAFQFKHRPMMFTNNDNLFDVSNRNDFNSDVKSWNESLTGSTLSQNMQSHHAYEYDKNTFFNKTPLNIFKTDRKESLNGELEISGLDESLQSHIGLKNYEIQHNADHNAKGSALSLYKQNLFIGDSSLDSDIFTDNIIGRQIPTLHEAYSEMDTLSDISRSGKDKEKPSLTNLEDDFEYKPSKKIKFEADHLHTSTIAATDHQHEYLIQSPNTEKFLLKKTPMIDVKESKKRLSGGSVSRIKSPIPADVFPQYLQSLNNTQEALENMTSETAVTQTMHKHVDKGIDKDSSIVNICERQGDSYILKTEMEDVLKEMSQLEKQDAYSQDRHDQIITNEANTLLSVQKGLSSMSQEADVFFVSDDRLTEDEIGYILNLGAKPEASDNKDCYKQNNTEQRAYNNWQQEKSSISEHGKNDTKPSPVDLQCGTDDAYIKEEIRDEQKSVKYTKTENRDVKDSEECDRKDIAVCNKVNSSNTVGALTTEIDKNFNFNLQLNPLSDQLQCDEGTMIQVPKLQKLSYEQNVQDSYVTSGRTQFTQTDSLKKNECIDCGTSPILSQEATCKVQHCNIGIQCDLSDLVKSKPIKPDFSNVQVYGKKSGIVHHGKKS